ncbi:MAG: glycoside hydrolase [Candidatus Dormibacteraeota bacterium]|nr:glycoside hydrolase [Candidatus Dormibacteraeota bacterium]
MVSGRGGGLGPPTDLDPKLRAADPRTGGGDYEPGLAAGPRPGQLYVTWKLYDSAFVQGKIQVIYSADRGRHFGSARQVNPQAATTPQGRPFIAVDGSGRLYVNWLDETHVDFSTNGGRAQIELASSGDHGRTFRTSAIAGIAAGCGANFVSSCIPRTSMAAGVSGHVYAAWSGATSNGRARVFFSSSSDGGRRWSRPVKVIPRAAGGDDQFRPGLSVAPNGRVDIDFYDTKRATDRQDVYLASRRGQNQAPSPAFRLDSVPSNTKFAPLLSDRIGVVASNSAAYAAWSDDRQATRATPQAQVFFAVLRITAPRIH